MKKTNVDKIEDHARQQGVLNDADAIQKNRVIMETVLNNVPNYIYVMDPSKNEIVFANEAFRRDFPGEEGLLTSELHRAILANCRACPEYNENSIAGGSRYFELDFEERGMWLGVRCSLIHWINGKDMRLFSCQDITEKKRHDEYIRRIAFMDHLTGLPNRYRCDADLEAAIEDARATGRFGYVLFIDMDDFKIVNDGYGHDYGDGILIEFAHFLNNAAGEGNSVFRFGGDEFVVLVDPSNAEGVDSLIKKLIERAAQPWPALDKTFYCTLSIGVVKFPDGGMGVKEIVKNADVAMYAAKKDGKNKYVFYDDGMYNDSIERAEMEKLMRGAIQNGYEGFSISYQPYVDIQSNRILGAEALIRWVTPSGKVIMPDEFISLAEYLGLIIPIGEYVLREAGRTLKRINDKIDPAFTVSVNISLRQLQQKDILGRVAEILEETGADPHNLVFDITEGTEVSEIERIMLICEELKTRGIHFAMDDFGTGYSSLGAMRNMPVDTIKIDRSFIRDITTDPYANTFITLITELAHSMQKQVCVKGVETPEQLDYCRRSKADAIQGYHLFMPLAETDLLKTIH